MIIFTITVFEKVVKDEFDFFADYGDQKTVGYYTKFEDAVYTVESNVCDIYDGRYGYAVVEAVPDGVYPTGYGEYKKYYFKYNINSNRYVLIDSNEVEIPHIKTTWSVRE